MKRKEKKKVIKSEGLGDQIIQSTHSKAVDFKDFYEGIFYSHLYLYVMI